MVGVKDQEARRFAELFPEVYAHFCRRWTPEEYRPSAEAAAVLEHLADIGPLTVTEAARHFGRSQAATSELLERLENRDLVERIPDERDRRRHLVWLTRTGKQLVKELRRVLDPTRLGRAFEKMTPDKRRELVAGMRALLKAARTRKEE